MLLRRAIDPAEQQQPDEPKRANDHEDGPPRAEGAKQAENHQRRDCCANRRAAVEQRDRPPAFATWKPLGDCFGRAGPVAGLAEPEQKTKRHEGCQPVRERGGDRGDRVKGDGDRQAEPGPDAIEQPPGAELADGIGGAKRNDDQREVGVAPVELGFQVRRQHTEGLTVEIVDDRR